MFSVRLVERPLPSTDRDVDGLIEWMVDSLCLVRKRGDMTADQGRAGMCESAQSRVFTPHSHRLLIERTRLHKPGLGCPLGVLP